MDLTTAGAVFIMSCYCLAALIDVQKYRLPDWLTWPAAIVAIPVSLEMRSYPDMLAGILWASGTLFFLYQKDVVGFGDVKLGISIGALTGLIGTMLALALAFLVVTCWRRLSNSETLLPFGPALIGCVFLVFPFLISLDFL